MEERKNSAARIRANNKYAAKAYDRINIAVSKGKKDIIQAHAEAHGESVNGFINRAIDQTMSRDDLEGHTAASAGGVVSVCSEGKTAALSASDGSVEGAAGNGAERRGDNE